MSIDYGMGLANIDREAGIRYGVISVNRLASHAWDTIASEGTDLDYAEAVENLTSELAAAIDSVLRDYAATYDKRELAESIVENLEIESRSGDCVRYAYESDGLAFTVCSDGDIFVTRSPFYTLADFCSPCAPGAGYLGSDGNVKTYCLGPNWFDGDNPMPYQCFAVNNANEQ